ncbi:uncharacterized protein LOC118419516 [Branchiostoma floridae]|uniref:Uncharacterized protein LOC118419516 n=1 Tax=Branchiostoma floridae TaxID=7739 RepID=A0A9J7LGR4_BRAFL|nr:uncharacterized protein LOC118419516 [Branchiostoma floridae]
MAETLLEGESQSENVAVSVGLTPTKQQTRDNAADIGSSVVLQQSPKDAEEVVDLLLRELIPEKDWDAVSNADPNPSVLAGEELAKADILENGISSHDRNHATAEGTGPVKPTSEKDVLSTQQCEEGNSDVSSILKDLDQCLGDPSSAGPSVVGTYVTEDDDVDSVSVMSKITAYLSGDDGQHFSIHEELQQDKGPMESLDTDGVEKTPNGIHEDFDGTNMLVDDELREAEDAPEVCASVDQECDVVTRCCNEAKGTRQVAVVKTKQCLGVEDTAIQTTGDADDIGIGSEENHTKCSLSKDDISKNRQSSHMGKDHVMAVSSKPKDCSYVSDNVIIDLCVTPEEEVDLVDLDAKNVLESSEDDPMDTDPQFKVIDVWPNPADSCGTPPKSLASSPIIRKTCSSNLDISELCDNRKTIHTSNQSSESKRYVISATAGLCASVEDKNERRKVGAIGRKAVPTDNGNVSGSLNSSKEVSLKTPQAEQASDVTGKPQASQDKQRNQMSVVCTSRSTKDCGSENSDWSVQQSSSAFLSSKGSKNKTKNTRPSSSVDYDAEILQQKKKAKRNPSPEITVKSDSKREKTKIKPIVWDRSPVHSSKTKNAVVLPPQKKVVLNSEGKQGFVAPTAKKEMVHKAKMSEPQKKTAIKKIVWDRSPARQKDTSKKSPMKDGDLEICISNKVEAAKEDVRLVYDPQKPLSPDSKNKLLEHLLMVEESQEVEAEEMQPSNLKVTVSKLDTKVTLSDTMAESDSPVPCKKIALDGGKGSSTVKSVVVKSKEKTKSVAAKSCSTTVQKSSKNRKHKTTDHGQEEKERLVVLKGQPKSIVHATALAHNSKGKTQNVVKDKEKSTSVKEAHSSDATKRKTRSKRRKKSSDSNGSNDGQGSSRKKVNVSNDIEDELSSLLEVAPIEVKVPRPKLSEKLQQEEKPPTKPKETCILKDPVDAEGVSEMLETGPGTEVNDLSEKLSKSRAKRQQEQKTSDEVQQVHFLASDTCKEDLSQHDMEDITDEQPLDEMEQAEEIRITRQVVITDDHISNIAAPEPSIMEEGLDTLDLNFGIDGTELQVTLPGESSDLKTTFQSMLEAEDFYNKNAEALHLRNPMEEIIAQERLMYNDTETSAKSISAALEGEDHGSDNMSGYETLDEIVDSDNEVPVSGSDSQTRQASKVSSPCVKASFIILPCQNQSPPVLKTTESLSSDISVFVNHSKPDSPEDRKECESAVVKGAALPSLTFTTDTICNKAAKVGSEFTLPEHAGVAQEESERVPSRIGLQVIESKDASKGTDPNDLSLSAPSTNVLCDKPVESVCEDQSKDDFSHELRQLLEKALVEALIHSDKESAGSNDAAALKDSSTKTSQNQIPTLGKEEEPSMEDSEQKSGATSAAVRDLSQMSSSGEKAAPCEHKSENTGSGVSVSNHSVFDDSCNDAVKCDGVVKLPPVGDDKTGQADTSVGIQATTEISPAVVLEVCIGGQGQDAMSIKPTEDKDTEISSIVKKEKEAPEEKPEEDQNPLKEPLKSSIVKSDFPAADIRVVQDSCKKEPPAENTSFKIGGQVDNKPSCSTDTTTVFTRLENSPQKKSESGVFNRLGGYSTKLKGKKSRAECCTKPRFHPYQGKTPTESQGQGEENDVHLCKESVEELNQMVAKEDKATGSRGRKKFKKPRPPRRGRSKLYSKLQDRLQQEGRDIRETYYLDDFSENPYDEGRFTHKGSDPVYYLEEMPCVRNDDPSDMTSKTYRFKATIKVKFPKRDKDFHCYPATQLPRFKNIPDQFPRHQINKEKTNNRH